MSSSDGIVDRISDLPDDLRGRILRCLPLSDVIKTSELSRKWRRTWTRITIFLFDESFWESMGTITETRFARIIERILFAHQGTLRYVYVFIPGHLKSRLYMNGWFMSLAKKELEALTITCTSISYPLCSMPSFFFDCGRLRHLSLDACVLKLPPNFHGFPNLVQCELDHIGISSNELAEFIYKCPRLETLALTDLLESFSEPLDISAPNLSTLMFSDFVSGMINLKNTPRLTDVSLTVFQDQNVLHKKLCSSFELLSSLSIIEKLTFNLSLLEPLEGDVPSPHNLGNTYVALTTLDLCRVNICRPTDISFVFCLVRSAPNLKTLNISMHYSETDDMKDEEASLECLAAEGRKGYNLSQLLKVKISGINGLKCETMLVKTMLSDCPVLRTLHMEASAEIKTDAELKMAWELVQCRRLSRDVQFVYSKV